MPLPSYARLALCVALCLAAGACSGRRTETFDIELQNKSARPLTLSLAKDGPPWEPTWATPEDYAIESPQLRETWESGMGGITVLPAGKTAFVEGLKGQFDRGTHGYVRAYTGELSISEMTARGPDSPDRVDVRLNPGPNRVEFVEVNGRIRAQYPERK